MGEHPLKRMEPGWNRYGFDWGPMRVTRCCHVEGRGYVLEIGTDHDRLQVYVSEKGRTVRATKPMGKYQGGTGKLPLDT